MSAVQTTLYASAEEESLLGYDHSRVDDVPHAGLHGGLVSCRLHRLHVGTRADVQDHGLPFGDPLYLVVHHLCHRDGDGHSALRRAVGDDRRHEWELLHLHLRVLLEQVGHPSRGGSGHRGVLELFQLDVEGTQGPQTSAVGQHVQRALRRSHRGFSSGLGAARGQWAHPSPGRGRGHPERARLRSVLSHGRAAGERMDESAHHARGPDRASASRVGALCRRLGHRDRLLWLSTASGLGPGRPRWFGRLLEALGRRGRGGRPRRPRRARRP
mmetsp:Transcript_74560/g.242080  ORF Transcript_74560/g.242080 Transcript_74560/m.242080 type:complete len:271 (-) Transcript_74560:783-1595(-)